MQNSTTNANTSSRKSKQTVSIENKFLLSFREGAQYFGIGEKKLRNIAKQKGFPAARVVDCETKLVRPLMEQWIIDNPEIFTD